MNDGIKIYFDSLTSVYCEDLQVLSALQLSWMIGLGK